MDNKKTGRPKKHKGEVANCSFKLDKEIYEQFKDFAAAAGESMSDLVTEYVTGLVGANAQMIEEYRARKSLAVKATFAPLQPETAQKSRSSKKKKPAQVDGKTATNAEPVKVGDEDENP